MSSNQPTLVQPTAPVTQPENITIEQAPATPAQTSTPTASTASQANQPTPIATKSVPAHYLVTIRGQAAITGGNNPQSVVYEETIACPDLGEGKADGHYMTYCLRDDLTGDGLLAGAIKAKYGHCEAIRTHELINRVFVNANGEKVEAKNVTIINGQQYLQVSQMRYSELIDYVNERKYSIDTDLYPSTDELRGAIDSYEKDKDAFVLAQEKVREDYRIKKDAEALATLNKNASLDI